MAGDDRSLEESELEALASLPISDHFIAHLLNKAESDHSELVRKLHDELGGMLIAASMDLAWAERHLGETKPEVREKLQRCGDALRNAIDMKRGMIESIRSTLLDNVGLYAALKWHMGHACSSSGLLLHETYHEPEPSFTRDASVALFRIAQDAIGLIAQHPSIGTVHCDLSVVDHEITLCLSDDSTHTRDGRATECASHTFLCITHRVRALGGHVTIGALPSGGTVIRATIPRANVVQ